MYLKPQLVVLCDAEYTRESERNVEILVCEGHGRRL